MQFYLLLTSLFLTSVIHLAHGLENIPAPFDDKQLPLSQRNGQEIEHLGHIIKLNTFFSPNNINSFDTKFSIYNRRKYVEDITFTPNKYCIPTICYGPYQYDLELIESSGFNSSLRTVILISGFLTDERVTWMEEAKDLWLKLEDVNVVLVTWKRANRYIYSTAVAHTPFVARQVTIFLYYLAAMNGLHLTDDTFAKNIHFIGHSLGSHIAGFVGQDFGGKMGRITGLDPAGPSFDLMRRKFRLDFKDARFVDVIHTNSGKLRYINAIASAVLKGFDTLFEKLPLLNTLSPLRGKNYNNIADTAWFGIDKQIGHIDYYANSGKIQPGCDDLLHICDHGRACEIYIDILKHELQLRHYAPTKDSLKLNRLLAFNSINYEHFLSGNNFESECPLLLKKRGKVDKTFKHCSVPIDQITPLDELMDELKTEYNVDFTKTNYHKYFFKTHSSSPLVGDHFLLKIRLNSPPYWERKCGLHASIKMADGSSTTVELNKEFKPIERGDFYEIVIPFVSPGGVKAYHSRLNNRVISGNLKSVTGLGQVSYLLPTEVRLTLSGIEPSNGLLGLSDLNGCVKKNSDNCHLSIVWLEVHPILGVKKNLAGLYGSMLKPTEGLSYHLLKSDEYMNLIKGFNKRHCLPLSPSTTGLTGKLDALMIT